MENIQILSTQLHRPFPPSPPPPLLPLPPPSSLTTFFLPLETVTKIKAQKKKDEKQNLGQKFLVAKDIIGCECFLSIIS
jgi:hypothetical protein